MTAHTDSLDTDLPNLRIARISTAPSLSGLSELEYHFGYLASNPDRIYFRLWKNSGHGKFNNDWIALANIEKALVKVPTDGSFTADALASLFLRRSNNSHYFTIACLLHAGLLQRTEGGYVRHTPTEWWVELQSLIEAGTHLQPSSMDRSAESITATIPKARAEVKKSAKKTAVITTHA